MYLDHLNEKQLYSMLLMAGKIPANQETSFYAVAAREISKRGLPISPEEGYNYNLSTKEAHEISQIFDTLLAAEEKKTNASHEKLYTVADNYYHMLKSALNRIYIAIVVVALLMLMILLKMN